MNKTKIVYGIGMVLAVLAVFIAPAAAQDYNIFHLVPEVSSCDPGEDVTVWVMVNTSYNDINAFQASIIFDPSVVNVTDVVKGTPAWYMWGWSVKNYDGNTYVMISGADVLGAFGPGELELGKMTLHCEAAGISSLHFASQSEVGYDRTQISHPDGVICGQAGNECTMEDGIFACNKSLPVGWNLVSRPDITADNSTASVLAGVYYDAVYRYDASSHTFVDVSDGTMEPGVGYFVHVASPSTWTYTGTPYTQMNVSLEPGLNMIGWLDCKKPISEALSSIEGKYWYAARWNATTQEYETYNPVAPPQFNDFDTLEPTTGYWISMKESGWLNVSC